MCALELTRRLLALGAIALVAALAAPADALAGYDIGWVASPDIGYCGGGSTTAAAGYVTNFAAGATGRCDWRSENVNGQGLRVSMVGFNYSRSNHACGADGFRDKRGWYGHASGSPLVDILPGTSNYACAGAGNYTADVRGHSVVHAMMRAVQALGQNGPNLTWMRFDGLVFNYEDIQGPSVYSQAITGTGTPVTTSSINGSQWVTGQVAVHFGTNDNAYYRGNAGSYITGSGGQSYEWPVPGDGVLGVWLDPGVDGAHSIVSWRDGAGHARSQLVSSFNVDRNAPSTPSISTGGYTPGTWSASPVTLSPSSSDGAGSGVAQYRWSDGPATAGARTFSSSGTATVSALARDGVGHDSGSSAATTVMVDVTAPSEASLDPGSYTPGEWTNADQVAIDLTPGADAHSGVAGTQYRTRHAADGASFGTWSSWGEGTEVVVSDEGVTEVQGRTVDNVGNASAASAPLVVRIDRTAPPAPGDPVVDQVGEAGDPTIAWAASGPDDLSGLAGYYLERNATRLNPGSPLGATLFTDTAPGPVPTYRVYSVDQAGNESASAGEIQVALDTRVSARSWGRDDLGEALCHLPSVVVPAGAQCGPDDDGGYEWSAD